MSTIMLGIGEYGVTNTPGTSVKTMALGSCVGLILMDPVIKAVGMVHIALPDSSVNPEITKDRPGYYADSGIPALLDSMSQLGTNGHNKRLIVKLVGGAKVSDPQNTFNIGKRNILAIKKILWTYGMGPRAEDVGGSIARTVSVDVDTGRTIITAAGRKDWEI